MASDSDNDCWSSYKRMLGELVDAPPSMVSKMVRKAEAYPLVDILKSKIGDFVHIKNMKQMKQFAGKWVVLRHDLYDFLMGTGVVGYVDSKMNEDYGLEHIVMCGYTITLLCAGYTGKIIISETCLESIVADIFPTRIRILEDSEKEEIKKYLDDNAEENQKCSDCYCFRLQTDEKHRRIIAKDVFDYRN